MEFPSRDRLTLGLFVFRPRKCFRPSPGIPRQGARRGHGLHTGRGGWRDRPPFKPQNRCAGRPSHQRNRALPLRFRGPRLVHHQGGSPWLLAVLAGEHCRPALADITVDPGLKPGEVPFKLDLLNPAVQDTRRNEMMPYQEKYGKGSSLHLVRFERFPSARTLKNGASQTRRLGPYVLIPVLGAQA